MTSGLLLLALLIPHAAPTAPVRIATPPAPASHGPADRERAAGHAGHALDAALPRPTEPGTRGHQPRADFATFIRPPSPRPSALRDRPPHAAARAVEARLLAESIRAP